MTSPAAAVAAAVTATDAALLQGDSFESLMTLHGKLPALLTGLRALIAKQSLSEAELCAHFRQVVVAACTSQRAEAGRAYLAFYEYGGRRYCCLHMKLMSDSGRPIYGYFPFDDARESRLWLDLKHHFTDQPQSRLGLRTGQLPVAVGVWEPVAAVALPAASNARASSAALLEGVQRAADSIVQSARSRLQKQAGVVTGFFHGDVVALAKNQPQPAVWLKQLQDVLRADARLTFDLQRQQWLSAAAVSALSPAAQSTSPSTTVSTASPSPRVTERAAVLPQVASAPPRLATVTHDALDNAPTYAEIVRTHSPEADDSDCELGELAAGAGEQQDEAKSSSGASAATAPPRLLQDRELSAGAVARAANGGPSSGSSRSPSSAVLDGAAATPQRSLSRSVSVDNEWRQLFFAPRAARPFAQQGVSVGDERFAQQFREAALLGTLAAGGETAGGPGVRRALYPEVEAVEPLYLNTHEPFCLCTVGVQGAGKSHTMGVVLESCLLPCDRPADQPIVRLERAMTALVLHFDQNVASICEATGLIEPNRQLRRLQRGESPCALPRERLVVLVSPSYYLQRFKFYGDSCLVRPLLFRWSTMSADHIKKLMRIKDGDSQLYVASMLELLRKYQRAGRVPEFQGFLEEVQAACKVPGQAAPLLQRAALLEALIAESTTNEPLRALGSDVLQAMRPGTLVVADLTDPLLASDEANGIFQVLVEQFRSAPSSADCGKLLALDEAHKFMDGSSSDGLSNAVVNAARLMRHDGLRLAVSTQSPKALAPELLELVSVAVMHRFHSQDWFSYLSAKIPLPASSFEEVMALPSGQALVFAANHRVSSSQAHDGPLLRVDVRARLTADRGASRTNVR